MKKIVFIRDELIKHVSVTEKTIGEWEQLKLLKPDGFTKDQIPFYSENTVEQITHIKNLLDLGYRLEDIQRIIKKVGLPKMERRPSEQAKLNEYLTVGGLAEQVGVSPRAIKHWEDKGIIEPDMRSEGGFRLYSEIYIYFCKLIRDLQLFGYSLEEIKEISDQFRDFLSIKNNSNIYSKGETATKLDEMLKGIQAFFEKTNPLKEGIERWENLLKKKKKEIFNLRIQNQKRSEHKGKNRK